MIEKKKGKGKNTIQQEKRVEMELGGKRIKRERRSENRLREALSGDWPPQQGKEVWRACF